ncbi:MAG: transposase, partial [Clostridiales bacterium]|nr:transposase [Clostridiales bacterium]
MKMLKRETEQRQAIEMLCVDMLAPKDHLLRKIDAAVDFTHIYELVEDLYCEDNGRPGCDPVVLFKLVLIRHLFGIRSLRQTMRDAEVNVAYRWFLGYTAESSALCDDQLCVLPSLYRRRDRRRVPLDTGGGRPGGVSVAGGRVCGRNAHQGERESEEAREEGNSRGSEAVSGTAGRGDR